MASLISEHKIEDGFWQLGLAFEHVSSYFAAPEKETIVPGNLSRALFVRLTKVEGWGPLTVHVEQGVILYGPNPNNDRPVEDGQASGEDSGGFREGLPRAKRGHRRTLYRKGSIPDKLPTDFE